MRLQILALCAAALTLVACGNADRGVVFQQPDPGANIGKIVHVTNTSSDSSLVSFDTCYPVSLYSPTGNLDISSALLFQSTTICPSTTNSDYIKINPGANLTPQQTVCFIPSIGSYLYSEKCMALTGPAMVELDVKGATRIDIVRASDLVQWKAYFTSGGVTGHPAGAFASFAFPSSAK